MPSRAITALALIAALTLTACSGGDTSDPQMNSNDANTEYIDNAPSDDSHMEAPAASSCPPAYIESQRNSGGDQEAMTEYDENMLINALGVRLPTAPTCLAAGDGDGGGDSTFFMAFWANPEDGLKDAIIETLAGVGYVASADRTILDGPLRLGIPTYESGADYTNYFGGAPLVVLWGTFEGGPDTSMPNSEGMSETATMTWQDACSIELDALNAIFADDGISFGPPTQDDVFASRCAYRAPDGQTVTMSLERYGAQTLETAASDGLTPYTVPDSEQAFANACAAARQYTEGFNDPVCESYGNTHVVIGGAVPTTVIFSPGTHYITVQLFNFSGTQDTEVRNLAIAEHLSRQ